MLSYSPERAAHSSQCSKESVANIFIFTLNHYLPFALYDVCADGAESMLVRLLMS